MHNILLPHSGRPRVQKINRERSPRDESDAMSIASRHETLKASIGMAIDEDYDEKDATVLDVDKPFQMRPGDCLLEAKLDAMYA